MRIKNQLKIISAFAMIVLIIFITFFMIAAMKYKNADAVLNIADDMQIKFFQASSLRDQYILYREDRPREQWVFINAKIDQYLQKMNSLKTKEEMLDSLFFSKKKSNALFNRIIQNTFYLKTANENKLAYQELDNRLVSQMHIRDYEFFNALQEIRDKFEKEVEKTYRHLIIAITALAVIFSFIVIFISFHLIRLISKRLEVIYAGAEIISQGTLEYRIKVEGDDEFSDLSRSINSMTSKLQSNNEQLELERARSVQNAKLASLGEMSASIAHEINNPLSVIQLTNLRLLDKLKQEYPRQEMFIHGLEKNQGAVERINKIIKSLSNISRDAVNEDIQMFSVEEMMEQVLSLVSQKLVYSGVELTVSIPPGGVYIESSVTQISQVLINLINNANDAIADLETKWIKVEFKLIKDHRIVQCSVTDSGSGIPAVLAEKIMQPFFTTKEVGKGTGLGLSISRDIIENLGGKFFIDNDCPNTRFVLELPKMFQK